MKKDCFQKNSVQTSDKLILNHLQSHSIHASVGFINRRTFAMQYGVSNALQYLILGNANAPDELTIDSSGLLMSFP
jgi:hypothetical protein